MPEERPFFLAFTNGFQKLSLWRGFGGQSPLTLLLPATRRQISEREEGAFGPYAEDGAAVHGSGLGEGDEFVVGGAVDTRLDGESAFTITDMKIGRWFACEQIVGDSDGVFGSGGDALVGVGAEAQGLGFAMAGPVEFYGDEGGVLDVDKAAFGGGFQQVFAVFIAFEDGGEQADHGFAGDRRTAIQPGAVAFNQEGQVAAINWSPRGVGAGDFCARGSVFGGGGWWLGGFALGVTHNLAIPGRSCSHQRLI